MAGTPGSEEARPMNHYAWWQYVFIFLVVIFGVIYALPNYYSESPAIEISLKSGLAMDSGTVNKVLETLKTDHLDYGSLKNNPDSFSLHFADTVSQMKAQEVILATLGDSYIVAMNFEPNTPAWLSTLGAEPMKYGLDLRGGMYFLLDIDMDAVFKNQMENLAAEFRQDLRENGIRYSGVIVSPDNTVLLNFRDPTMLGQAQSYIQSHQADITVQQISVSQLKVNLIPSQLQQIRQNAVEQTIQVMRNRVNELGVGDATVSQQGQDRVVIELPGLQDATRAKQIIGGTATLKVMMVNESADIQNALNGKLPIGSSLYYGADNLNHQPYVLYDRVLLTGKSFVGAALGYDSQTSLPVVNVNLSGPEVSYFSQSTAENVGHLMAIVSVQPEMKISLNKQGQPVTTTTTTSQIISVATVDSRLGNNFQIMGIGSTRSAQLLALSIQAGALPAPVQIIEDRLIGPTLGAQNIHMGSISVLVALILVIIFIAIYYRVMGLIANSALILNLILIVAIMSVIPGATLTLPGIAGIVLNLGMAIDANVLIFERIREELRNGMAVQAAIQTGYAKAFATIVDANVTTLIVAVILYAIGTGAIKGFAVTLIIGIICSMFTAITVTRGIVNAAWGGRTVKKLSIGI